MSVYSFFDSAQNDSCDSAQNDSCDFAQNDSCDFAQNDSCGSAENDSCDSAQSDRCMDLTNFLFSQNFSSLSSLFIHHTHERKTTTLYCCRCSSDLAGSWQSQRTNGLYY